MGAHSLVIDAGNHRVKIGHFHEGKLTSVHVFPLGAEREIYHFLNHHPGDKAIVSSVSISEEALKAMLPEQADVIILHGLLPLPVELAYLTRETLGKDRIAAVCGARAMFPGEALLVVDAGTCMTLDHVSADGLWTGGNISPGIFMRLQAMHQFTGRLPLVGPGQRIGQLWGDSTNSAMANGAVMGMVAELEGYADRLAGKEHGLKIVLTGGDAPILAELTKTWIFVEPNLVLTGLHEILQYHT